LTHDFFADFIFFSLKTFFTSAKANMRKRSRRSSLSRRWRHKSRSPSKRSNRRKHRGKPRTSWYHRQEAKNVTLNDIINQIRHNDDDMNRIRYNADDHDIIELSSDSNSSEDDEVMKIKTSLDKVQDEPVEQNDKDEQKDACTICNDRKRIIMPNCGHRHFCKACALHLLETTKQCPTCRAPINSLMRVFI
jgi:hypothetical protein